MIAVRSLAALIPALGLLTAAGAAEGPDLKQAEAEADRLDPGWRLADLQAKRPKIPQEKDGAAHVLEVFRAMPQEWKELGRTSNGLGTPQGALDAYWTATKDDPTKPAPPEVVAALKAHQAKIGPVLARARDLEKYATGHYEVIIGRNPMAAQIPHVQDARAVARLLQFDGLARAAACDADGVLAAGRALLGVARSVGDEPMLISQLVRTAIDALAVDVIQTALARGQASEAALAATQAALASEAAQPILLDAMRGERALIYDALDKIASEKISPSELAGPGVTLPLPAARALPDARGDQAIALHLLTRAVEISKKPLPDQPALWDRWEADIWEVDQNRHPIAYTLLPAAIPASPSHLRSRALLRTAETMVGLERVRRARGRWPRPGESLAPAFKDGPPADPFSGKPILWKATPTGLVVYSVGSDRRDDGGTLDIKNFRKAGTDLGFRLWDAQRRPKAAPLRR